MSITPSELQLFQAATMAANTSTSSVGGAISATRITGGSIGEVFFMTSSATTGGGSKLQYEKVFYKNTDATLALTSSVVYIKNGLISIVSAHTVSVVSSSTSDNSTLKIRIIGYDNTGAANQEELTMNGTTTVTGSVTWATISRVEFRLVSSGVLTAATGDISVTADALLGKIPSTFYSATNEVTIGLVGTLDGSSTTTNSTTAPSGISFSLPNTQAGGLAVANTQSLTAGSAQGIWCLWTLKERMNPSADIQVVLTLAGNSA